MLVALDAAVHIGHRLPALVGVDDQRDGEDLGHPAGLLDHLGRGEDSVVGYGVVHHARPVATHVGGWETDLLDDAARQGGVALGRDKRLPGHERSQLVARGHGCAS